MEIMSITLVSRPTNHVIFLITERRTLPYPHQYNEYDRW